VVSFLTIGIIWVNHHAVMDRIKNVNRTLLFLNLVFLMAVAAIPFPTALLADYLQAGHDERLASAIYGATMALMGIAFGLIWAYAVLSDALLHEGVDPDRARRSLLIFAAGNPLYLLAIGVSLLSARLGLAIYALLTLFYFYSTCYLRWRSGRQAGLRDHKLTASPLSSCRVQPTVQANFREPRTCELRRIPLPKRSKKSLSSLSSAKIAVISQRNESSSLCFVGF
jgi:uncharacterized membrane protein